jgi:hypothetical protein
LLAIFIAIVFTTVRPISDPDCWFHMAHGRHFLEHGEVLKRDIFSHTAAGREWISSGWFASVIMQWVFARWGPPGLTFLVTLLVASVYGGLYLAALRRHLSAELLAIVLLSSLLAGYMRFNPRPDLFSLIMFPLLLVLLEHADEGLSQTKRLRRGAWLIPIVIAVWANLHAGFLAGLIVMAIWLGMSVFRHWAELETRTKLVLCTWVLLCFSAWLVNPYGWRILQLAAKIRAIPGVRMLVFEWMPLVYLPGFNLPWPTYVGFVALGALWWWAWRAKQTAQRSWHGVTMLFLAAFALWQRRQAGLFALGVPVLILPYLDVLEAGWTRFRQAFAACAIAGAGSICALQYSGTLEMGNGLPVIGVNARMLPCIPTEYLEQVRVPQKLFNSYGMGGYLLYHLRERLPVFIDGRLDVYDPSVWLDYLAVDENRLSIAAIREKYGINTFAIETRDAVGDPIHLATRLAKDPAWALLFFDDDYAVFAYRAACAPEVRAQELRFVNPYDPQRLLAALRSRDSQGAALRELAEAVKRSNGSALAYALAALAAEQTGEREAAAQYRALAVQRDPNCPLLRGAPPLSVEQAPIN